MTSVAQKGTEQYRRDDMRNNIIGTRFNGQQDANIETDLIENGI